MERPKPKAPKMKPLIVVRTQIVDPSSGRFLLCQRVDTGQWEFPGGKIDPREDLTAAALREVKEETKAEIILTSPFAIFERRILGPKPGKQHLTGLLRISHIATAELVSDPSALRRDPDEVAAIRWCHKEDMSGFRLRQEMSNILALTAQIELGQMALAA